MSDPASRLIFLAQTQRRHTLASAILFFFQSPKRLLSSSFEGRENVSDLVRSIEH